MMYCFRWCKLLEDDIYTPVNNEENELSKSIEKVADETETFEGLGEKYQKNSMRK